MMNFSTNILEEILVFGKEAGDNTGIGLKKGVFSLITQEAAQEIHNNYLPSVDYTNVRELYNPRPSLVNRDDDVGGAESHGEISVEEDVIGKATTPIVEERFIDSSVTDVIGTADMSEPSIIPFVNDTTGKTVKSSLVSEKSVDVSGNVDPEVGNMDMSRVEDTDGTPSGGDVLRPTIDDSVKDTTGTEPVTAEPIDEGVIPSVFDTGAGTAEGVEKPTVGQEEEAQEVADDSEPSKPKNKLSMEERVAKHARKVETKARRDAENTEKAVEVEAADADVHEVAEEEVPPVAQPTVFDEWLPEHEQHDRNAEEEVQESKEEDIAVAIRRRRKATGKLKLNENRTRVGNKKVPKNVVEVSTANVVLNFEEDHAKWRFFANRRVAGEKISEATKKNVNIIGILEGARVVTTRLESPAPGFITISPKLIQGTHVPNISLQAKETSGESGSRNEETARILRDEIRHLDGVIQTSVTKKSVLEARLRNLSGDGNSDVDPAISGSGAEASHT
ncbi:hypothetical protein LIER_31480 [Lithospermum erythrorhizon]|uniref:Uncharacterized protein n=1 Tax=Lithospermum erythrorhizon TaxID=34254 RepID=A0AAV3RS48_LITER